MARRALALVNESGRYIQGLLECRLIFPSPLMGRLAPVRAGERVHPPALLKLVE